MTETAGQKIAARSKEVAADLRRPRDLSDATPDAMSDATPHSTPAAPSADENVHDSGE